MREWKNKLHFEGTYDVFQSGGEVRVYKNSQASEIVFNPEDYDNEANMWKDVADLMRILHNTDMVARVRREESLVIVEYIRNNSDSVFLEFIGAQEGVMLDEMRVDDCDTIKKLLEPELIKADEN